MLRSLLPAVASSPRRRSRYCTTRCAHTHLHSNVIRGPETGQSDFLFLERIELLEEAWEASSESDRCHRVRELLSAHRRLGKLG
ncbi:hypothetical protein SAMD00023353_10300190 [Rosellinia necatrix]|uniref:Uncharacterized protein n=1 Tax=Rosellinia necatrix TaxID=77044 RepID=A0A1S8ABK4_ROSNE|nr:hypothetical protein SAMD00023353_10300190 [Rosellinia necatrix]